MLLSSAVGPRGRVYATDIQPTMLALIKKRIGEKGVSNVELVRGTAKGSGLSDGIIDLALKVDVYHELAQPQAFQQFVEARDGRQEGGWF